MKREEGIILHLESLDQLVEPCAPSPFLKRRLREDAEKFITEQAETVPRDRTPRFILHVAGATPSKHTTSRKPSVSTSRSGATRQKKNSGESGASAGGVS